jgi:S1-C subfamily serine protease
MYTRKHPVLWRFPMALCCLLLFLLVPPASAQDLPPAGEDSSLETGSMPGAALSPADIATLAQPSVVQVVTPDGSGTGFGVAAGVLTAAHVVGDATQVQMVASDGSVQIASVARVDSSRDLALLTPDQPLPALDLELAASQRQGTDVVLLGYPLDLGKQSTLTRGIISAVRLNDNGLDFVQTDAAVAPGNSGGPLLNVQGKVIGMLILGARVQGFNLAIATETINSFLMSADPIANSPLLPPETSKAPPIQSVTSRNWAGYIATDGDFSAVSATWSVPAAANVKTPTTVSTWVGIGGLRGSDLLEAGTEVSVSGGKAIYRAWMEHLPDPEQAVSLEVHPGDELNVTIEQQSPGTWHIAFANHTTNHAADQIVQYASSKSSADWIQGLASTGTKNGTLTPFDAYNSVSFSNAWTIKDGQRHALGDVATAAITLVSSDTRQSLAVPSELDPSGSGFTISREK